MKIACSSQTFDTQLLEKKLSLEEFFQICSTHDFIKGVELEDKHIFYPENQEYLNSIVELTQQYQLPIVNLAFDCNFGYESIEKNELELQKVQDWIKVAKTLQIPNFRLFAGWPDVNKEAQWDTMIQFVHKASDLIEQAGMTVVIENHNHGGFLSYSDDVVRMFKDLNRPSIKLLLDTGNYVDQLSGVLKTAHYSGHVHAKVKEITETGEAVDIEYLPMMKKLSEIQYQGWLSIEYEGTGEPKSIVKLFGEFLQNNLTELLEV